MEQMGEGNTHGQEKCRGHREQGADGARRHAVDTQSRWEQGADGGRRHAGDRGSR